LIGVKMDALIDSIIFASIIMLAGLVSTGAFIFFLYLVGVYDD